jgi:RND family efflux transporter MFP subunit
MKKTIILIVVLAIMALAAWQLKQIHDRNTVQSENISLNEAAVTTAGVIRKPVKIELDLTGSVSPVKELDIPAETQGKIVSLNCALGMSVQKGTVIALIDDKIKKIAVASAKIDAEKARKDFERTENLFKGGTSSGQEYDNANSAYESAKNKLEEAEKQLAYTKITSSIAGTITKKNIEEGTYVNPGTVIATVVDISRLKAKLNVSESNVYYLKTAGTVKLTTPVYPGTEFTATISYISPSGDDAHNYQVELEMANSPKTPLKAGTFVTAHIVIDPQREGLFIPREALQGSAKKAQVYVVENGKARLKDIVIGSQGNEYLEVISGLKENDKIVVSGQVNLTDNRAIKIINQN